MNIADIRERLAYNPTATPTVKAATSAWLNGITSHYPIALTLTLKQQVAYENAKGACVRAITQTDCERIAKRFTQKLNRAVFGKRKARTQSASLKFITVVEGERSGKRLHLHFAIGGLPSTLKLSEFANRVRQAKVLVEGIDEQHKLDIADSGWMDYICKELSNKDTDNVLWTIA